jgi:phosphonate transport system permease protein
VSAGSRSQVEALWRERARSRFLRSSLVVLLAAGVLSVVLVGADLADALSARRLANLERFLGEDACPRVLQEGGGLAALGAWVLGVLRDGGAEAALRTLAIALAATGLAALGGALLALLGARELADRDPFAGRRTPSWRTPLARVVRLASVVLRAIPEYILAFLLLGLFGATAWPAVLALAIHNAGILGRLGAEVVEDLERRPVRALVEAGASPGRLVLAGVLPLAAGRYLLYALYRLETCLREATVLGLLGIASLGAAVEEARARGRYDELLLLVLVAALLVAGVEAASRGARRRLRGRG